MSDKIHLSPRLECVYALASGGKVVADVGTDHGLIPIKLILDGNARSVIASDIREGPLDAARRGAESFGVSDKIRFVLADGLDFDGAEDCDTVIIAGMGGETTAGILRRARQLREDVRLVLQPQTKIDELWNALGSLGFGVETARLCEDAGRLYFALRASRGGKTGLSPEETLLENRDPLLGVWLDARIRRLETAISGQEKSASGADGETVSALRRLCEIRGRI